ncbi:DUF3142 domain-containing protein [Pseudomonas gingeri]|uniref:DUF3142 domain-containing protein n=1 Tax=Pseudomonas gingeri TaxID=117681 RepID=A0A7Y7YA76_9PSED|nr:DUF3142 domain-containing protein [Pseudomonas gingeri]NWA04186.1 DUF3142 domain-containing protein [Pseudomonas gingeri]NWA17532.1 DUF3142 domain-containing protein [Pseudomonas gingeri]NWA56493.1 DUF3142 domain-containing protein [Pseudomonas gingeri]NWA97803.1 DUF3142 domain-containing protein [Pseudomonas gingeri]NWB05356.1 DUF3142 domain-containing protein [Pseudomonas gingeri]
MPVTSYFRWLLVCLVPGLLLGCQPEPPRPLDQQLYVWQRQWRPAHEQALARSRADFSTLRVLALQAQPRAGWSRALVNLAQLKADGRPVIAVVRLDGQLPSLDADMARTQIAQLLADWQAGGVMPVGLEIDHDSGSARLPGYSDFLLKLRSQLPPSLKLSITALPAWLDSPQLPALLQAVDSSVLQVHAVSNPRLGLFNPGQARDWAERWGRISDKPFYLALPAYGMALLPDSEGAPVVESETPLNRGGERRELLADPQQLATLVGQLREKPPAHLAGLIWFRLPLPGDRRAWSLTTLRAVARGEVLASQWRVELSARDGLYDIRLDNVGNLDRALPERIELTVEQCDGADGLNGYTLQQTPRHLVFTRRSSARIAAGGQRVLGWARCTRIDQGAWNVYP